MAAFNLTAELNLRGPSNLSQVVGNIKRQLSTVSLNLNINPSTSAGIRSITSDVNNLSVALRDAQTNATALDTALRNLGASAANVSNAAAALNTAGAAIRNVNNNANAAARGINNARSEMAEFGRQSALAIRRFAAFSVATGGIYAVTRAISSAYGEFIKFDQEFVRLQQVTDGTASSLKGLSNEISRLSTSLGVSSQDLLNVSVTLAQAGMSATETRTALEALAKSSLAPSFDDLNNTVEGSIALMRQFGIGAGDLESSLSSINSVAAKFAVEAGDIITAIQRTGGVFAASSRGVSEGKDALNEFIAVFTSVRATTRESAETIATGLRTIFTRIQRGSTISALREYGVELTDLQGKFVGPYEAVRRLSEGLKSLDPRDLKFSAIVEELGGFRQIGKVLPLIQQFATAQQALGVAQRGAGSLTADAATAQESLANKMTKVREQFVTLIRDIGKSDNFKTFVDISLKLASALISVADAAKNVLPAIAALAAIRAVPAVGQFVSGFTGGLGRRRGFAAGGLVPGSGSGDTVPAMLTPGEFVIRKNAVQAIGVGNLHSMNRYAQGGMVQKFAGGRGVKGPRGARSNFKELTPEEISKLTTKELIAYGKKLAQNIFTTGGAGMVTRMEFIPVPANRIVPELESSLKTYRGQKGFWREKISPFGRVDQAKMDKVSSQQSREVALKKQESRMADEVAARSQQWAAIRSGSPIDSHLLSALKEPILSDYKTVRAGGSLSKPFHETRLRQSVNKALDAYDDFDYSPGNIDKLVSGMAAKRFASGGMVQKFAKGQSVKKLNLSAMPNDPENYILQNLIDPGTGRYRFGIAALRSGGSKVKTFQQFNIGYGSKDNPQQAGVDLYIGALSNRPNSNISSDIESNITSSLRRTIGRTAERLAQEFGVKTISGSSRRAVLQGTTLNSAVGSVFEGALGLLGAPYIDKAESIKSMDFPFGMGENLATQFFGNGSLGRMPTDATRTFGGAGKNASDFKNQIKRFLNAVNNKEFAKLSQQKTPTSPFAKTLLGASSGMTADRRAAINSILSKYGIPANLTKRTPRSGQETISIGLSNNPSAIDEIKKLMEARASGGSIQDTVPALLTPGEFVINKSAAQRLGSSTLHRLNNADKIGGYNKGGFVGGVQHFAGGGGVLGSVFGMFTGVLQTLSGSFRSLISNINTASISLRGFRPNPAFGFPATGTGTARPGGPRAGTRDFSNQGSAIPQNGGMGTMAFLFIGPMIAESINSALSKNFGKSGAQAGSMLTAGISGATVGAAFGPQVAAIGAIVGLTTSLFNLTSVANEYQKNQNDLALDMKSSQLDKSFEKLSKQAVLTAGDLASIGSNIDQIITLSSQNRDITNQEARTGGGFSGMVSRSYKDSILGWIVDNISGADTRQVDQSIDVPKLTRDILTNSQQPAAYVDKYLALRAKNGESFDEIKTGSGLGKTILKKTSDPNAELQYNGQKLTEFDRLLAIGRNPQIAQIEADIQNKRAELDRPLTEQDRLLATRELTFLEDTLARKIAEGVSIRREEFNAIQNSNQAIGSIVIQLDLFAQQVEQLGNIVNRADAEFKEAVRMRQIRTSSQLGEATIVGPSRLNEDIINNPTAYTAQALKETISNLGQTAGWTPEFTTRAENTALAAQVLQTKLPEILLREGARNANNDFSEEVRKELEQALAPIAALQGPDFKLEQFISALENSLKSEIGDSRGKSPTELAQNPEIQKLLKPLLDSLKVFGSTQKSFNDVLEATAKELNAYSGYMSRILDLQISASTIALDARNNLNKALGNPVTLSDMNSPFNTSIQALTSDFVNGRPVVGTGTLDPAEIARRLAIADENLAKVNEEKVPVAGTPQFDDYNSRLAAAKRSVDRLTKAQEKLATDATRASNALSRIQELKQAQDARKGVFTDLLGNLQNPEWIIDFENKVASLQKVMAGRGDIKDIKAAQEAFNMRIAGMDPNDRKAESDKFYGEIKDILIRRGIDPNLVNDNMRLAGLIGGPDAVMQSAIGEYNTAIQAQIEATNNMAGRMEQGSEKFYQMVVDAAKEFSNRVKEAGGIPKTDDVKVNAQEGVQLKSTGGLIYASGGKLINFQPRGTDTIPAMLTPGEFVVNARATSKNLGLLQAINGGETQKLSSGGLVYLAEGGRSDDDVQEILRKNRERIAEADKVKAMDNYDKAYQEARSSLEDNVDSLDWTYDYLDRANIDRDSTIGQFLLDKAYARYHDVVSAKVDGDEFDKENSDAFLSDRDKESAAAVVALREREKARKQAIEQAELKKKDKEAREAAAIGVGQQLAGKDRPKDMQGYLFRSADGRFDQMGDIADVTTDNKGNISVTIKKVGGDEDGSLTKPIPLGSLDNASQFVVQSYMRQKDKDREESFEAGGAMTLDDVEKQAQKKARDDAFEAEINKLSRGVKVDTSYSVPVLGIFPQAKAPSVVSSMGKIDPALSTTSRATAWSRARDMAIEMIGDETGLMEGSEQFKTMGVKQELYYALVKAGIIGNDQRQTESVDDLRLREIVSGVVEKERSTRISRSRDKGRMERSREKQGETARLLGEGLYNSTGTRAVGEALYGTGEALIGGAQGIVAGSAAGITSVGVVGSTIVDMMRGVKDEEGSATTQALVAAAKSMFESSGAGFSTFGTGADRLGGAMTFDMEEMRQNSKDSALAAQEKRRREELSGESLGRYRLGKNLELRLPSSREIYDAANFVRDSAIEELATGGAGHVVGGIASESARAVGLVDDAAKVASKGKTAAAPITSAEEIARVRAAMEEATSPLGKARAKDLLQQADETPVFQPEVVRNPGRARVEALNPDKTAEAVAELRGATQTSDKISLWNPFPEPPPKIVETRAARDIGLRGVEGSWSNYKNNPAWRQLRENRVRAYKGDKWIAENIVRFGSWIRDKSKKVYSSLRTTLGETASRADEVKIPESFGSPMDSGISLEDTPRMSYDSAQEVLNKWRQKQAELAARRAENAAKPSVNPLAPEPPPVPPIVEKTVKPPLRVTPEQTAEREALLAQRKAELAARRAERAQGRVVKNMPESYEDDVFKLGEGLSDEEDNVIIVQGSKQENSSGFFGKGIDDSQPGAVVIDNTPAGEKGFFDIYQYSDDSSLFDYEARQALLEAKVYEESQKLGARKTALGLDKGRPEDYKPGLFRKIFGKKKIPKLTQQRQQAQRLYDTKAALFQELEQNVGYGIDPTEAAKVMDYIQNMKESQIRAYSNVAQIIRDVSGGGVSGSDVLADLFRFSGKNNLEWIDDPKLAKSLTEEARKRIAASGRPVSKKMDAFYSSGKNSGQKTVAISKNIDDNGIHEALHVYQDMVGAYDAGFDDLASRGGAYFNNFLNKDYDKIYRVLRGKKSLYTSKYIRTAPKGDREFLTVMGEAMNNPETRKMLQESRGIDILRNIFSSYGHGYATGGVVYASGGKLVNFQPRGTDTVPAMLTPGEFVVNAKSAQKNLGLLHAINNGSKGYSSGGVVYLARGGTVPEIEARIASDQAEWDALKQSMLEDQETFFYWALSNKGGGMTRSWGMDVYKDGKLQNPRTDLPSSKAWFESDRKGRLQEGEAGYQNQEDSKQDKKNPPPMYSLTSEYLANVMGRANWDKLSANDQNTQITDMMGNFDAMWESIQEDARNSGKLWWQTDTWTAGESAALQAMRDAQAKADEIEKRIREDRQELEDKKTTPPTVVVAPGAAGGPGASAAAAAVAKALSDAKAAKLKEVLDAPMTALMDVAVDNKTKVDAEAQKVLESVTNTPEANYEDEITYKQFLDKLISDKKPIVPPDQSRFTTPAYYVKEKIAEAEVDEDGNIVTPAKYVTTRATAFDSRQTGDGRKPINRLQGDASKAREILNEKLIQLDEQASALRQKAKGQDVTVDPLKTEIDGFLSAVNQILATGAAEQGNNGTPIQGASPNNNPASLGGFNVGNKSVEYTLSDLQSGSLPSSLNPSGWQDEAKAKGQAQIDQAIANGNTASITGYKSAKSQYDSAVKYYIRKRGEYNYAMNQQDKKDSYNKMMEDRRQAYADAKEARRQAYLDNQRGRQQAVQMSTGGVVYAQSGMLVPYQPRGTDTVPAMLTPGEFVVNRAAAQKNIGLLKSINSGKNVAPQLFSSGGFVNVEYHSSKPNVGTPSSSSGGMPDIKVDASPLDNFGSIFSKAAEMVGSAVSEFVQGSDALKGLSAAFSSLTSGTSLLANAATSVGGASTTLAEKITSFNTSAEKLATALSSLDKMTLTLKTEPLVVSGNISVTIEGNTGNADTGKLEQSIIDKISDKVNAATNGGINIKNTA